MATVFFFSHNCGLGKYMFVLYIFAPFYVVSNNLFPLKVLLTFVTFVSVPY